MFHLNNARALQAALCLGVGFLVISWWTAHADTVSVPVSLATGAPVFTSLEAPVLLQDFEDGSHPYSGVNGGLGTGSGYEGDWCWVGTPHSELDVPYVSFRVDYSGDPPVLVQPYASMMMKASKEIDATVLFSYFDGSVRNSKGVAVHLTPEWQEQFISLADLWDPDTYPAPRIADVQVWTEAVGVDIYADALYNTSRALHPKPLPDPEPEPEPESPAKYHVELSVDVTITKTN